MAEFKIASAVFVMFLLILLGLIFLNLLTTWIIQFMFQLEHKFNLLVGVAIVASSVTSAIILVSMLYGQGAFS